MVERLVIMAPVDVIDADDLPAPLRQKETAPAAGAARERSLKDARDNFERAYILTELHTNDWNATRTAQRLGIERSHLYRKLKAYNINRSATPERPRPASSRSDPVDEEDRQEHKERVELVLAGKTAAGQPALTTTVVRETRVVRAPRDVRIAVHLAPEEPGAADEYLERGRNEHGGCACCLDCKREIVDSEISIT